jgi:DNA-binding protein YbaB
MTQATALKLLAEDAEDLKVVAAALQDAVGKIGDISYEPTARRLTLAFNRYRWEAKGGERVRSALQVGSVLGVQARKLRRNAKDAVVELLNVAFEPGEAPGGTVTFTFAGGGDLRAQVECLDVILADVSAPWPTPRTPRHET